MRRKSRLLLRALARTEMRQEFGDPAASNSARRLPTGSLVIPNRISPQTIVQVTT